MRFIENENIHKPKHMRARIQKRIASEVKQAEKLGDKLRTSDRINSEVLHEFRISLRKIQASARILHQVDGRAQVHSTLIRVKNLLKATGLLRAEHTLPKVFSSKRQKSDSHSLIRVRRPVLLALETRLNSNLEKYLPHNFGGSIRHQILEPLAEVGNMKFRRRTEGLIERDCKRLRSMTVKLKNQKAGVKFYHKLRIRAKKLGYVLEILEPELKPHVRKISHLIKKNQKVFGRLHDLDSVIKMLRGSRSHLKVSDRRTLSKQLKHERPGLLKKALAEGNKLTKKL